MMKNLFKKTLFLFAFLCLSLATLSAYGKPEMSPGDENQQQKSISFIDDEGTPIQLNAPVQRAIALYTAHVENIYSIGAGSQLLGAYTSTIYPPQARKKAQYTYRGDAESIIAANPDCVIIRPHITAKNPEFVAQLRMAGIPVISLYPQSFDDFDAYIHTLGLIFGKEQEAQAMLETFHRNLASIQEQSAPIKNKQTVFFEATDKNVRTASATSLPSRAIEIAGGINIAQDAKHLVAGSTIASYGAEKVVSHAKDIDVYIVQKGAMHAAIDLQTIAERPGFNTIKAIQDGRCFILSESLISSPTFRYYQGVKEIARFLYPDVFDDVGSYENDELCTLANLATIIMHLKHLPLYTPISSKYYTEKRLGHTYGTFEDVQWDNTDFDAIETAVSAGFVPFTTIDHKDYYYPQSLVTRDMLSSSLIKVAGKEPMDQHLFIKDKDQCKNPQAVQNLVDHGILNLDSNNNFNPAMTLTQREVITAIEKILQVQ